MFLKPTFQLHHRKQTFYKPSSIQKLMALSALELCIYVRLGAFRNRFGRWVKQCRYDIRHPNVCYVRKHKETEASPITVQDKPFQHAAAIKIYEDQHDSEHMFEIRMRMRLEGQKDSVD
jgi:hypothetical protein